ncbi:MAG: hypothetical protein ACHQFW_08025 [Chitinophagales bacterium]
MKNLKQIIGVAVLFVMVLTACSNYGTEKEFNGVQLFYTSSITEAEADSLGNYLIAAQFADGEKKSVQLNKDGDTYEFRMVVKEGYDTNDEFFAIAQAFASELSAGVFHGSPVEVHLCDDQLETLREVPMGMTAQ